LELSTEEDIEDRLGKLPDTLKKTYDEMYENISARGKHAKTLADRAFMWVMCAVEPLSSEMLLDAVRFGTSGNFTMDTKIDESTLLDICKNLLVVDSQRKVWRFSHLSVTEYIEEHHWSLQQAHCHVARCCLLFLPELYRTNCVTETDFLAYQYPSQEEEPIRHSFIRRPKMTFRHYTINFWIEHVRANENEGATDPELSRLLKLFLGPPNVSSKQYQKWLNEQRYQHNFIIRPVTVSIFTMCRFSLYNLLDDWWRDEEIDLNLRNLGGDNPLTVAAAASSRTICQALIDRGSPVDLQLLKSDYCSALAVAAYSGNLDVVKCLVENGKADANMMLQAGKYGSALAAAVLEGNLDTVKYLVENGKADANMMLQSGKCGSALAAAATANTPLGDNLRTVKYLVKNGKADVNMVLQSGDYGSALAAAAGWTQNLDTVKYLVENGKADVNLKLEYGNYGSALAAARKEDNRNIVKFLIQAGARDEISEAKSTSDNEAVEAANQVSEES
jgi:ankyrin repeat domain-containing protein 50